MNVEARLAELIGPAAGRLHTARSRNDQVALDFRLWVRAACDRTVEQIIGLQRALLAQAETHAATLMPGFTHLQPRPAGDLRPPPDGLCRDVRPRRRPLRRRPGADEREPAGRRGAGRHARFRSTAR